MYQFRQTFGEICLKEQPFENTLPKVQVRLTTAKAIQKLGFVKKKSLWVALISIKTFSFRIFNDLPTVNYMHAGFPIKFLTLSIVSYQKYNIN